MLAYGRRVAAALFGLATLHLHPRFGAVSTFFAADAIALVIALTAPTSGNAWRPSAPSIALGAARSC